MLDFRALISVYGSSSCLASAMSTPDPDTDTPLLCDATFLADELVGAAILGSSE